MTDLALTSRLLLVIILGTSWGTAATAQTTPGPHIVPIDEKLYAMEEPPSYEPFDVYGIFLMSVAAQQTPLVMNPGTPVPEGVV